MIARHIQSIRVATGSVIATKRLIAQCLRLLDVGGLVRGMQPAGPNLLVIRTGAGAAQRVALALDRSGWPEMVGNIGGDDTVFVATDSAASQKILLAKIERARS